MGLCSLTHRQTHILLAQPAVHLPPAPHKARGGEKGAPIHQALTCSSGPRGELVCCDPAGWDLLAQGTAPVAVTDKLDDWGSGRENGHLVTGPSRPTSQPKIYLFQEASQPCPRPTAQHPLKLHRRDPCPINHPRQASTRPASAPASIAGHFLPHLQLLPSQAGPEAHPGRDRAARGQRAGTVSLPRKLGGRPPPLGQGTQLVTFNCTQLCQEHSSTHFTER